MMRPNRQWVTDHSLCEVQVSVLQVYVLSCFIGIRTGAVTRSSLLENLLLNTVNTCTSSNCISKPLNGKISQVTDS